VSAFGQYLAFGRFRCRRVGLSCSIAATVFLFGHPEKEAIKMFAS